MERTWRLDDGARTSTVEGVRRPEWRGLEDPCPDCGTRAFRHVATVGGRYGSVDGVVTRRSEYWEADASLLTQCLACDAVLYKHPAFDVRFGTGDGGAGVDF